MYKKYQHIVRIDDPECEGILNGRVYVFHKLDGTNGQVWQEDGEVHCGSRNKEITIENDNRGMARNVSQDERYKRFFEKYPDVKLFGEYLIKNHVTYYDLDAWNKFYVFDVVITDDAGNLEYIPYEEYTLMLEEFGIEYIPVIAILSDPNINDLTPYLDKCTYLCGEKTGEGIVVKNYNYVNRYGNIIWGKIVRDEFKQQKKQNWQRKSDPKFNDVNDRILNKFCTEPFIQKEYYKLLHEFEEQNIDPKRRENRGQFIGQLLQRVYQTLIEEEMWHIVKKLQNPTINFLLLKKEVTRKIKETLPDLF